ncbi:MAG: Crp/Fnr family transcriptional regulator [Bdellovibrionales bacterium]|nr:Crp/Fnr family transcriptional regulator [Bdellovibrionales bacterium]
MGFDKENGLRAALVELSNFQIFSDLDSSTIASLCEGGSVVLSSHREALFEAGAQAKYFGVVLSGAYKLSRPSPNGDDTIIHFSTPGDVVGAFIMAQDNPKFPVTARAMGPSRFLKIPRENYCSRWKERPELIIKIQNLLSNRMTQMHIAKTMQRSTLSAKVAALLIDLVNRETESKDEAILPLPLTRKEIADNLGSSVESVIRVMSEWSKQGLIETNDQHIKILKVDKIINEIGDGSL